MITSQRFQQLLGQFEIAELFNEMGWDNPRLNEQSVEVEDMAFQLVPVAQKRGVFVFLCSPDPSGSIPPRPIQMKIERQARKIAHEHLLVFTDTEKTTLTWLWVARSPDQPAVTRTHTWHKGTSGESLRQKLGAIVWSIEDEEAITLTDVTTGLRNAFDRDQISKQFYTRFKQEHEAFSAFIKGIDSATDKAWYGPLILNRLRFIYFIQRKGFLDGKTNYLREKLNEVRERKGGGNFHSFYRVFLRRLFHEALATPKHQRDAQFDKLVGSVPYLNGGLFDLHQLEEDNPAIDIPDDAFERLFEFFDAWDWHLDNRPLATGNEINPDVLGYIFEKYINQKQMGAYYTKEDITEYIAKNTIIPYLLDKARERCKVAFDGDESVWNLLQEDPDRYIYSALKTGVVDSEGELVPGEDLPHYVQVSLKDPSARMLNNHYNHGEAIFMTSTGERGTLPTETWREYVERRSRCLEIRGTLAAARAQSADQLITLNLDIRQFMQDIIDTSTGPQLLRAIWQAIVGRIPERSNETFRKGITILDPTCGSGAFLFAALNILEPLYEACLDRMEAFIEDAKKLGRKPESDFVRVLEEIGKHPSRSYYVYKTIILNNLYGVDIMAEAVEICKLRLFLKLVSQVDREQDLEPLPDMDFNIRTGNTLVGFSTKEDFDQSSDLASDHKKKVKIKARVADLADLFNRFREQQTIHGGRVTADQKRELREKLDDLSLELDHYLARDYGIDVDRPKDLMRWRENHNPLHWFSEFYEIMLHGGFDVVIGNPPYISSKKIKAYSILGYDTAGCTDIYAWCLERVTKIIHDGGRSGMIVPMSISFSKPFRQLRKVLYASYRSSWFSHFAKRPSMLFHGVQTRNVIHIGAIGHNTNETYTTKLHRWSTNARSELFNQIVYSRFLPNAWSCIPKAQGGPVLRAFEEISNSNRLKTILSRDPTPFPLYFKKIGYNWISFGEFIPPAYDENGSEIAQNQFGTAYMRDNEAKKLALLLLNGRIAFFYWILTGDDFHVTKTNIEEIPFNPTQISKGAKTSLLKLADKLSESMKGSITYMTMHNKKLGNFNANHYRAITDQSDRIFAEEFALTPVWDQIELLHSQVVRSAID